MYKDIKQTQSIEFFVCTLNSQIYSKHVVAAYLQSASVTKNKKKRCFSYCLLTSTISSLKFPLVSELLALVPSLESTKIRFSLAQVFLLLWNLLCADKRVSLTFGGGKLMAYKINGSRAD